MKKQKVAELTAKTKAEDKSVTATPPTVMVSTNGSKYKLSKDGKSVKKINDFSQLKDIVEIDGKREAGQFMKTLHLFLLDKDPETFRKGAFIQCRFYRLYFSEAGFVIKDMKKFMEVCDDFNNPFPTPKEVWEYISKPKPVAKPKKADDDDVITKGKVLKGVAVSSKANIKKVEKLINDFKDLKKAQTEEVPKKAEPEELTEEILNLRRVAVVKYLKRATSVENMIEKCREQLPHRGYRVFLGKLIRQRKKGMRYAKFVAELIKLTEEQSFGVPRKPAEKFEGLTMWEINELEITPDNQCKLIVNGKSPYTVSKGELLARYLISEFPGVMPQLVKAVKGEITFEEFIAEPIKRDRFVAFEYKYIKQRPEELAAACEEILYDLEEQNPLKVVYKNDVALEKGDKIKVYHDDLHSAFKVTVVSVSSGIKLLFEDGDIIKLMKNQPWKKI